MKKLIFILCILLSINANANILLGYVIGKQSGNQPVQNTGNSFIEISDCSDNEDKSLIPIGSINFIRPYKDKNNKVDKTSIRYDRGNFGCLDIPYNEFIKELKGKK